jgi:membrane-bound metal-dependent hydrolase YbcI (DUF457 family)
MHGIICSGLYYKSLLGISTTLVYIFSKNLSIEIEYSRIDVIFSDVGIGMMGVYFMHLCLDVFTTTSLLYLS